MMRLSLLALWVASFAPMALAAPKLLEFRISASCIKQISVNESHVSGRWTLDIELTDKESNHFYHVTEQHIGHQLAIVDTTGASIGFPAATIRAPLSGRFRLASFKSKALANAAKKQILTQQANCQFHP